MSATLWIILNDHHVTMIVAAATLFAFAHGPSLCISEGIDCGCSPFDCNMVVVQANQSSSSSQRPMMLTMTACNKDMQ